MFALSFVLLTQVQVPVAPITIAPQSYVQNRQPYDLLHLYVVPGVPGPAHLHIWVCDGFGWGWVEWSNRPQISTAHNGQTLHYTIPVGQLVGDSQFYMVWVECCSGFVHDPNEQLYGEAGSFFEAR